MNFNRTKKYLITLLMIMSVFVGGCSFDFLSQPTYEKFEVTYTPNLELLVGEEWKDDLIKGTGIKKDETKEDVTSIMTIDKSEYKKDTPGKYKIYFKLEEIKLDYEVSVVEKITNTTTINARLDPVITNSFKVIDNVLKFEASNTTPYEDFDFSEKLIYEDNNGEFSVYYNWKIDENNICEVWYVGTETEGKMIFKQYKEYATDVKETADYSLEEYQEYILNDLADDLYRDVTPTIDFEDILSLEEALFDGELTLSNNVYKLEKAVNNSTISLKYSNNVVTEYNGIKLTFGNQITTPEAQTIHQITRPIINETYKRTDGILTYKASTEYYLDNNGNYQYDTGDTLVEENVFYVDDNGQITIYTKWIIDGETLVEIWYTGTENDGLTIVRTAEEVSAFDDINSCELYSVYLFSLGEALEIPIEIYPMIVNNLETIELSGMITDYGEGDYYLREYQEDINEYFTFYANNNIIIAINGVDIMFGEDVTLDIPAIPQQ